jgi:hypothetical protein
MKSKIELQIAELILRDLPYTQRRQIAAALEDELARRLRAQNLPSNLLIPEIQVDDLHVSSGSDPADIAAQIAEQVVGGMTAAQQSNGV